MHHSHMTTKVVRCNTLNYIDAVSLNIDDEEGPRWKRSPVIYRRPYKDEVVSSVVGFNGSAEVYSVLRFMSSLIVPLSLQRKEKLTLQGKELKQRS